jgi:murein DD-endopeptidase MepM/ murein hydrolase activator NlpD
MKYLGSMAQRRKRKRTPRIIAILGVATIVACVAFALIRDGSPPAPVATQGSFDASFEVALPGQRNQLTPSTGGLAVRSSASRKSSPAAIGEIQNGGAGARANSDWINVTVAPGDNLSLIFSRLKLSKSDLHTIVSQDGKNSQFKRLKPGQIIRFKVLDSELESLVLELDDLNSLWAERSGKSFSIRTETIEPEIRVAAATAEIRRSLFLDGQKVGLSDALIMRLTDIFGWDIDFALDIREHDHFSVIYEEVYKDDLLIKQGRILAAEFINQGKSLRAVLFTDEHGKSDYYSDQGQAMRKAFLRTPVNFTRISSRFNLKRKHPVLNTIRAHRGVDYAAPRGTPVRATADGKVRSVGTNGGYGRVIEIQHGETYQTLYAHLSRFARGVKRGAWVGQGKIIGYVGKSGLATGPHLHYEFRVNGTHRNPLTVDLPKAEPIDKRYLVEFKTRAAPLLNQLTVLIENHDSGNPNFVAQLDADALRLFQANNRQR